MINNSDFGKTEIITSGLINNLQVTIEVGFNPVPHDSLFLDISDTGEIYENSDLTLKLLGVSNPYEDIKKRLHENKAYVYLKSVPHKNSKTPINLVFSKSISKNGKATHKNGNIALSEIVGSDKSINYWYPVFSSELNQVAVSVNFKETLKTISEISIRKNVSGNPPTITIALPRLPEQEIFELVTIFNQYVVKGAPTSTKTNKINDLKQKLLSSNNKNHFLITQSFDKTPEKTLGDNLSSLHANKAKALEGINTGDLILINSLETKNLKYIYEVVDVHSNESIFNFDFNELYEFNDKTRWDDLHTNDPLDRVFLDEMLGKDFETEQSLKYEVFIAVLNITELNPLEVSSTVELPNENIPTLRDTPAVIDQLNRKSLADSFCKQINELWQHEDKEYTESDKLYAVHVQGPWGSGKSTFLNLIDQNFTEKDENGKEKWLVIKYNAWKNQHIDPPWWTLIDTIYKQASEKVSRKGMFVIKEWWRRLIIGNAYYLILTGVILSITIGISIFVIPALFPENNTETIIEITTSGKSENEIKRTKITDAGSKSLLEKFAIALTLISGILLSSKTLHTSIKSTLISGDQASIKSFKTLSRDPQAKIKWYYCKLLSHINKPLAVFVDDLDRCNPKYTVDFLEGLLTLFREQKVLYIIAADKKWLANCFEIQYEKFVKNYDQRGTTLGYQFIQKVFQLSIRLPNITISAMEKYWRNILHMEEKQPGSMVEKRLSTEKKLESLDTEDEIINEATKLSEDGNYTDPSVFSAVVERLSDSKIEADTEKHILEDYSCYLEPNPRSIKRLVNYYKLFRNSLLLEGKIINRSYIIRWIVLSQRWPILSEALEKNPSLIEEIPEAIHEEKIKNLMNNKDVKFLITGKKDNLPFTLEIVQNLIDS